MTPSMRPPQLPPRSPRYPPKGALQGLSTEEELLEAPASPPLPYDAVPKDGEDFVSGPTEDFVAQVGGPLLPRRRGSSRKTPLLDPPPLHNSSSLHNISNHNHNSSRSLFWRASSKVASTDVASVGNASDTSIPGCHTGHRNGQERLTGRALHEHAKVALNAEEFHTALLAFEALLEAQMQRFGPCHASVAAAMHNVGVCRQRMGQFALAENLLAEAVQIRRQTLGPDHVEVAASLSKLGSVRLQAGRFEEAFADLQKALKIANKLEKPKTIAQMQCHLGCFYFQAQELFAAQATFQEALTLYRQFWQEESANMGAADRNALMLQLTDTLCNIGTIQNRRKRFSHAITSFQEALDLQRGVLPVDSPRILSTLDNLAYAYSKNKEYARAVTCYKNMLRAQVSHYGTFTSDCLETIRKRLLMYEKLKLPHQAVEDLKEVVVWQKTLLSREDPLFLETKKLLEEWTGKRNARR